MQGLFLNKKLVKFILVFLAIFSIVCLSSCDKDSSSGEFIYRIEDASSDKLVRLAWDFVGTANKKLYDVSVYCGTNYEETNVKHNPSKNYVELDSSISNSFKVTVSLMDNPEISKTVNIYLVEAISNEKIEIFYENNNNVKIKFDKQIENSTCYIKLDNETYTQAENEINLGTDQVNYKEIKICERTEYTDNTGTKCYKLSKYSSPLLIELAQSPILTFKAISTDEFMFKCDSFNGYDKFDIELVQNDQVIFSEKNVTKKRFSGGTFTIKQSEVLDADLTMNVYCYGSLTETQKVADLKCSKTYKYVDMDDLEIVDGAINCEVKDNMESYLLDVKSFSDMKVSNYSFVETKEYKFTAQEAYSLKANIVYKGQFFSKTKTKDWFSFYAKPTLKLENRATLTYSIATKNANNANVHLTISKDGKSINSFDILSNVFTVNGESKKYVTDSGIYYISVVLNPVEGAVKLLDGNIPCDLYPSETATAIVVKTETPEVEVLKADNGRAIEFKIEGYDEYKILIPGQVTGLFTYNNKYSSYLLSNEALNFDNATRTVTIVAKKKGFDENNAVVLESEPVEISDIKIISQPKNSIEVLMSKDGNPLLSFTDKDASTGKYNAYLYYVSTGNYENFISMIKINDAYQFNFNDFFKSTDEIKAGTYNVKVERTSDINTDLNSKTVVFQVQKLDAPSLDREESRDELICWKNKVSDNISGYRVKFNDNVYETLDVNRAIDKEALNPGESTLEIVAYGTGLTIWSNPLIVRLYKFEQAQLEIKDCILKYNNTFNDKIVVNTLGTMYYEDAVVEEGGFTGNYTNLRDLTSSKYFNTKNDKVFKIIVTLDGRSDYYDFIYESQTEISFQKLGCPEINLQTMHDIYERPYMMKVDDGNWAENSDYSAPALTHKLYFYRKGDGTYTIDSVIVEK